MRERREELGISQEAVGVSIGIDESSARARISRYELGVHEPPLPTVRLIASKLNVPFAYLYCDNDLVAKLLSRLHRIEKDKLEKQIQVFFDILDMSEQE